MTLRTAAVLLAGIVWLGCSSKGDPGQAGQSVLSAQLAVGSVDCPAGGSQFTSISATTFACNGAQGQQGIQGDPGPKGDKGDPGPAVDTSRLVVKTQTGEVLGPLLQATEHGPSLSLSVYITSLGKIANGVDQATGRLSTSTVYYAGNDCSGATWHSPDGRSGTVWANGSRIWTQASRTQASFTYLSSMEGTGSLCTNTGVSPANGFGVRIQEVFDSRYPYEPPLQIVYE